MIRCIAVDDEPLALDILKNYVERCPDLKLLGVFSDSHAAKEFLGSTVIDLMFLDVEMPGMTGIELIRKLNVTKPVILSTAYPEYALEGFDLNVVDYLLKPYSFRRFERAVQKYKTLYAPAIYGASGMPGAGDSDLSTVSSSSLSSSAFSSASSSLSSSLSTGGENIRAASRDSVSPPVDFIYVKSDQRIIKVAYDAIRFIEGMKDYIIIHTDRERIVTLQLMRKMEQLLPSDRFMRIHRSFIVSLTHIDRIDRNKVCIAEQWIPIGETYKEAFFKKSLQHRI